MTKDIQTVGLSMAESNQQLFPDDITARKGQANPPGLFYVTQNILIPAFTEVKSKIKNKKSKLQS